MKGVYGSKLILDKKKEFGYVFPCEGPSKGNTCNISALGHLLLIRFLDIEHYWMVYIVFTLEAYW